MKLATLTHETLTAPADRRVLDLAEAALARGRYLPLDAPFARTTAGELARDPLPGPRALGYGPPAAWLLDSTKAEGNQVATLTWRSVAPPPAGRTVVGRFRAGQGAWRAAARLLAARPAGLVVLDVCNHVAGAWLLGADDAAERLLVARLEGDADAVARGHRAAWQAVELERGQPYVFEQARGPWRWGPVHPPLADEALLLRWAAAPDALPALMDGLDEAASLVGPVAGRAHVASGLLYGSLPPSARQAEALRWLSGVTLGLGARMEQPFAATTSQPRGG